MQFVAYFTKYHSLCVGLYIPEYDNADQGLSYGEVGGRGSEWKGRSGQQSRRSSKMVGKINIFNKKIIFSAQKNLNF
jgi:hypothetical protein